MNRIRSIGVGVALVFAATAAMAGKPPPKAPAVIPAAYYDSLGQLIGPLIYSGGLGIIRVGDLALYVEFTRDGPNGPLFPGGAGAGWVEREVFFDQPACFGNAYNGNMASLPGLNAVGAVTRSLSGNHVLYVSPIVVATRVVVYSTLYEGNCTELVSPIEADWLPVTSIVDLSKYQLPIFLK